mgnify:FL=1
MNWNSKRNPLGNADDPIPPMWWNIEVRYGMTERKWIPNWNWLAKVLIFMGWFFYRNPLHNFMFYWIGFKNGSLDYSQIWNQKQSWNLVLPFFSKKFKSGREFYIGWRPDTRAFGMAWRKK